MNMKKWLICIQCIMYLVEYMARRHRFRRDENEAKRTSIDRLCDFVRPL